MSLFKKKSKVREIIIPACYGKYSNGAHSFRQESRYLEDRVYQIINRCEHLNCGLTLVEMEVD